MLPEHQVAPAQTWVGEAFFRGSPASLVAACCSLGGGDQVVAAILGCIPGGTNQAFSQIHSFIPTHQD